MIYRHDEITGMVTKGELYNELFGHPRRKVRVRKLRKADGDDEYLSVVYCDALIVFIPRKRSRSKILEIIKNMGFVLYAVEENDGIKKAWYVNHNGYELLIGKGLKKF